MSEINLMDTEEVMQHWDRWRTYIASGGGGSWPSDAFESFVYWYIERIKELEQENATLKGVLDPLCARLNIEYYGQVLSTVSAFQMELAKLRGAAEWVIETEETYSWLTGSTTGDTEIDDMAIEEMLDIVFMSLENLKQALTETTSPQSPP